MVFVNINWAAHKEVVSFNVYKRRWGVDVYTENNSVHTRNSLVEAVF